MDTRLPPPKRPLGLFARIIRFVRRLAGFTLRVLRDFMRNRGLLLASAVGYNTLLSIVPLFAVVIVILSTIVDEPVLIQAIATPAEALLPGQGSAVTEAFSAFVERRNVIGGVGFLVLLFFSALAFRVLDDSIGILFHRHRQRRRAPHPLRAFALPLAYVAIISIGILAITFIMTAFDALPEQGVRVLGLAIAPSTAVPIVKTLAFVGLVLLLSSFYAVMPRAGVRARRALAGGLVAAVLWEATRSFMTWYFANLSLVDVVYGSLGTVVVLLLGLEMASVILLLGAQTIAELEHAAEHGRPWYDPGPPDDEPTSPSESFVRARALK
jgi:membrane protein